MRFGSKFTEEAATATAGDGGFARGFKPGETTVRFLEEMEEGYSTGPWTMYREHFDPQEQKSYPCLGDKRICPGCNSDNDRERRATQRYLANALTPDGYVNLYKIPQSLINTLLKLANRDKGSITKRDYTIDREGEGLKTTYNAFPEDPAQVDVESYKDEMLDHQKVLMEAFVDAWGKTPDEIVEDMENGIYPRKAGSPATARRGRSEDDRPRRRRDDEDEDPWADTSGPYSNRRSSRDDDEPRRRRSDDDDDRPRRRREEEDDEPPFKDTQRDEEGDSSEEEEVSYSREDLLDMSTKRLIKVYEMAGVEQNEEIVGHEEMVDYLIEKIQESQ